MKHLWLIVTVSLASSPCLAAVGWKSLFNGRNLDGWRNYGSSLGPVHRWSVEDGSLTGSEDVNILSMLSVKLSTDLIYYPEQFGNFELRLEWKVEAGGNGGILERTMTDHGIQASKCRFWITNATGIGGSTPIAQEACMTSRQPRRRLFSPLVNGMLCSL